MKTLRTLPAEKGWDKHFPGKRDTVTTMAVTRRGRGRAYDAENRIEKDLGEVEESIWTGSRQQSGESGVISAAVSGECQGSLGESRAAAGALGPSGMMP